MIGLLILSVGLAMDAFAVSLVRGSVGERTLLRAAELGVAFGAAQGLMPLLGWVLADSFGGVVRMIDHWIAFVLLSVLGGRMLWEVFTAEEDTSVGSHSRLLGLLVAAFATSIDAAAAGLTFNLLDLAVPVACVTIGVTTALLCVAGYLLGATASKTLGKAAEILGGLVLIGLGIKILIEHTMG